VLELWSPDGAFARIEAYLREHGFFAAGGEELVADVYLGYGLSEPLRRSAAPSPPEPCRLPLAAVSVRDTSQQDMSQRLSLGHVRSGPSQIGRWRRSWTDDEYGTAVEAVRDLPVRLVVTTGPGVDPQTLGGQPKNVAVTGFVPQALILERADLLVSQAGAGTMLGALVHGVPQVCVPRGADQPWNAAAVERAGAGLVVPPDAFSGEAVRAAVERVLARSSYAAAADRVAREIGTMLPAPVLLPELLETMADREVA